MRTWILAGFVSCSLLASGPAQAQKDGAQDQVAADHMSQGRWLEAAQVLRELVASAPTATRVFNLAQAERNMGALADAKRHFRECLERARLEGKTPVEQAAAASLKDLEGKVPYVTVELDPRAEEVEVRVDGRVVHLDPENGLEVNPGTRQLMVSAPGYERFERAVSAGVGERVQVKVSLSRASKPHSDAGADASKDAAGDSSLPPTASLILGGVGIVAVAGGGYMFLRTKSKFDEASALCPCTEADRPEFESLVDEGQSSQLVGGVLVGVGAAALGTAALLWVLEDKPTSTTQVGVVPVAGGMQAAFRTSLF
ncbi:MAG: hypothetical protein R3B13_04655 [Polyangiaceae bacterium]